MSNGNWKLVPEEPTSEMIAAAVFCLNNVNVRKAARAEGMTTKLQLRQFKARRRYLAMLAAAPAGKEKD